MACSRSSLRVWQSKVSQQSQKFTWSSLVWPVGGDIPSPVILSQYQSVKANRGVLLASRQERYSLGVRMLKIRKIDISLVFIRQFFFAAPKNISLNCMHDFVMKTPNKRGLHQIAFNNLSDIDFQDIINLYQKCISKPYFFYWFILLLHLIIFYVSERIFWGKIWKLVTTTIRLEMKIYNMILTD